MPFQVTFFIPRYTKLLTVLIGAGRLALTLFLTSLEITVVTTALIDITNHLGGLERGAWLISSYLLGYVGMWWEHLLNFRSVDMTNAD